MRRAISILFLCAWWDYSHVQAESVDVGGGGLYPDIPLMAVLIKQKCFLPTCNVWFPFKTMCLTGTQNLTTQLQGQNLTFQHIFFRQHFQGAGFNIGIWMNIKY